MGSLQAIAEVVNRSAQCNHAQLVSREDGSTIVHTYNWTDFFAPRMKKITGIKKLHHFRIDSASPGCVFTKEQCDSPEVKHELLKAPWTPDVDSLPAVVPPRGLSAETMVSVRPDTAPFCPAEDMDSRLSTSVYPETRKQTRHPTSRGRPYRPSTT